MHEIFNLDSMTRVVSSENNSEILFLLWLILFTFMCIVLSSVSD